jgi:nitrogen fixation/metabolism regulation signal transduction histidine kinase
MVVAAALAGVALHVLLTSLAANTAMFTRYYPLLVLLNALLALALVGIVIRQVRRLWRENRDGVFGAKLKTRLVLMLAAMAVVPGVLLYAVSVQFVTRSIETWFDVKVEKALESGLALGRSALDALLEDLAGRGEAMAIELAGQPDPVRRAMLGRLREQHGVPAAALFTPGGTLISTASSVVGGQRLSVPDTADLRQARLGRTLKRVDVADEGGAVLHVLVRVAARELADEPRLLQLTQPVPAALMRNADEVQAVYRDYQELQLGRAGLTQIYALTLTMTVLLALSAALAIAFYFARRLSAPLSFLAEGTQAVAQGDFTPRRAFRSRDELGVLTQSFNQMTRQLDEARRDAERHRQELEAARAYLESVLANLSAGVLVFDRRFVLRLKNAGAGAILGDDFVGLLGQALESWPRQAAFARALRDGFAGSPESPWQNQLELARDAGPSAGLPQFLLLRGSRLPEAGGGGYVLVFDDITRLVAGQKAAVWGEVARRLAHEIKNPLTPIQLAAERLPRKLDAQLDEAGREILARGVQTIVEQVRAMKEMVDDFRDYARLPPPVLGRLDLNALVGDVLALYEGSQVAISHRLAEGGAFVAGDRTQLRQVIHNLLRNAEDAAGEGGHIELATSVGADGVRLSVIDDGPGFPSEIISRIFEPYVTSKARGTGLGLAIVKKIVDEHDGRIVVANREPRGARVEVLLPGLRGSGGGDAAEAAGVPPAAPQAHTTAPRDVAKEPNEVPAAQRSAPPAPEGN